MAEDGVTGFSPGTVEIQQRVVRVLVEFDVAEVFAGEETELPEVVGDVLADIGDGAVRADDDFGVFVRDISSLFAFGGSGAAHDLAAFVLAGGL